MTDAPTGPADGPAPRQQDSAAAAESDRWEDKIRLPNGLSFYLTSRNMLGATKFVLKEIFVRKRYYRPGFQIRPGDTVIDVGANMPHMSHLKRFPIIVMLLSGNDRAIHCSR